MKITVNSEPKEVNATNISELLEELSIESRGVAIAVNNMVIARNNWATTTLNQEDSIVVVSAVFGG